MIESPKSLPSAPSSGSGGPAPVRLSGLGNRFVELLGRRLPPRDFAAETARIVTRSMRVKGVAVLGYDSRTKRLLCLATEGLHEEARQALGGSGECPWEIPVRGLHNRRISVIASAHQNPFVPRPLAALSPRGLSIASLPVYDGAEPVGVLLLFGVGNQAFPDSSLRSLSQALRVCARGLRCQAEADGHEAETTAERSGSLLQPPGTAAGNGAATETRENGEAPLESPGPEREGTASRAPAPSPELEAKLSQALEELERSAQTVRRLTASANALTRERDVLVQQLAELERTRETDLVQARAEVSSLQDRLLASESERARQQRVLESQTTAMRQAAAALETERDELKARTQAAENSLATVEESLRHVRGERDDLGARVTALEAKVKAAQETLQRAQQRFAEERTTLETDRDAWQEQSTSLRAELQRQAENLAEVERNLRTTTVQRDGTSAQVQEARRETESLLVALEESRAETAKADSARAAAVAEAAALRKSLEEERRRSLSAAERLQHELTEAHGEVERRAGELAELQGTLADRDEVLRRREEEVASLQRSRQGAEAAEAAARGAAVALRADLATLATQFEQATEERKELGAERDRLRAALTEARRIAGEADSARSATERQLQAEGAELRRQLEELGAVLAKADARLRESEEERRTLTVQRAESARRAETLAERLREAGEESQRIQAERDKAAEQVQQLAAELQTERERAQRTESTRQNEHQAHEAERAELTERLKAKQAELERRGGEAERLREEVSGLAAARDASAQERRAAQEQTQLLEERANELEQNLTGAEARAAEAAGELEVLREARDEERTAARQHAEGLQRALLEARAAADEAQQRLQALSAERDEQARRQRADEERIRALQAEIGTLRDRSSRGEVLQEQLRAQEAVAADLERQRDAAEESREHAARERDALGEQLAAALQEQDASRALIRELQREQERLRTAETGHAAEAEGMRAALARATALHEDVAGHAQTEREAHEAALAQWRKADEELRATNEALTAEVESAREECALLRDQHAAVERQLQLALEGRGEEEQALARELEAARHEIARLDEARSQLRTDLAETQRKLRHAVSAAAELEEREQTRNARLSEESLRADAAEKWGAAFAHVLTQTERQHDDATAGLARAERELEALREQNEEALRTAAQRAGELQQQGRRAEKQRTDLARRLAETERARDALTAELEGERNRQAESSAAAERARAWLQAEIEDLRAQGQRLLAEERQWRSDAEAQETKAEELEAQVDALRDEAQRLAEEHAEDGRRVTEANGRVQELTEELRLRDTAVQEAEIEQGRLLARVDELAERLGAEEEAGERLRAERDAERRVMEARCEEAVEQVRSLQAQIAELSDASGYAEGAVARLEEARAGAVARAESLRQTLEQERAARLAREEDLQASLEAARLESQWLSTQVEEAKRSGAQGEDEKAELRRARVAAEHGKAAEQERAEALRRQVSELQAHVEESERECRRVDAERAELERQLAATAASRGEQEQVLAEALRSARQEADRLQSQCNELHEALREAEQKTTEAEVQRTDTEECLRVEAQSLREQIEAVTSERGSLATRLGEAERALAAHAENLTRANERAAELAQRCEGLDRSAKDTEAGHSALQDELAAARRENESLRQRATESEALDHRVGELSGRTEQLEQRLTATRERVLQVEGERDALTAQLESLQTEKSVARTAAEGELQRSREALLAEQAERGRLAAELASRNEALDELRSERARILAELEQTKACGISAQETQDNLEERLRAAQERIRELSTLVRQRDQAISGASTRGAELEQSLRLSEEKFAALSIEHDELRQRIFDGDGARPVSPSQETSPAPVQADGPLAIERTGAGDGDDEVAATDVTEEPEANPGVTEGDSAALALLDVGSRTEDALAALAEAGFEVTSGTPTPETVKGLQSTKVSCVMLNLAAGPSAWRALKALREQESTRQVPILAYLMPPDAQRGFCFGRADFDFWPMDAARATERLGQLRPRLRRVLAVSADIDGMGRIREPLAQANISASIVLDGKQALELASILNPEAAVLHLTPACTGVGRAIAGLRAEEATRDAPFLILLDKAPPREELFFSRTVRELLSRPNFEFKNLPEELARLLA